MRFIESSITLPSSYNQNMKITINKNSKKSEKSPFKMKVKSSIHCILQLISQKSHKQHKTKFKEEEIEKLCRGKQIR
jgi:hypothetical protein